MDDVEWAEVTSMLAAAASRLALLSRCLDASGQLQSWRACADETAGGDAANALDQARGDLERLAGGEATATLEMVERTLTELPLPWE